MLRLLSKIRKYFKIYFSNIRSTIVFLITIIISLIMLFSPIKLTSTAYKFDSNNDSRDKSILLLEPNPKNIEIEIRNMNILENEYISITTSAEFEDSQSLRIYIKDSILNTEISKSKYKQKIVLEQKLYQSIKILYENFGNSLIVKLDNIEVAKSELDVKPNVTGLHIKTSKINQRILAKIETMPHTRELTLVRLLTLFLLFLLTALSVDYRRRKKIRNLSFKIDRIDLVMIGLLIVVGLVSPPGIDDGEILSTQRSYNNFGFASTYSSSYPLGQWWFLLSSIWAKAFDQIFFLRVPNLLCYFLAWILIDRLIVKSLVDKQKINFTRRSNLLIFSVFSIGWAGTLRYDPIAVLGIAILLVTGYQFLRSKNRNWIVLFAITWAMLITSSLAGWIATFTLFTLLYISYQRKILSKVVILEIICFTLSWTVSVLFYNSNLWLIRNDIITFTSGGSTHRVLPFNEFERYRSIFEFWGSAAQFSTYLFIGTFLVSIFSFVHMKKFAKGENFDLFKLSLSAIPGLLLTSSKYGWHFQVYGPVVLVLLTILIKYVNKMRFMLPALILAPFGIWISLRATNKYNYVESITYRVNGPVDYFGNIISRIYGQNNSFILILIMYVLIILFLYLLNNKILIQLIILATHVAIVLPTLSYPILDASRAVGWQFTKQTVFGFSNEKWRCGLAGQAEVISTLVPLDEISRTRISARKIEYANLELQVNELTDGGIGEVSFLIPEKQQNLFLWFKGITTPGEGTIEIELVTKSKTLSKKSLELNNNISKGDWQIIELNTQGSDEIKIGMQIQDGLEFAFLNPSIVKFSTLDSNFANKRGSVNSYRANLVNFPCQTKDNKYEGVKNIPEYQFGLTTNMARDAIINFEVDLFPVGCLNMLNIPAKTSNCFYKILLKGEDNWNHEKIEHLSKGISIF